MPAVSLNSSQINLSVPEYSTKHEPPPAIGLVFDILTVLLAAASLLVAYLHFKLERGRDKGTQIDNGVEDEIEIVILSGKTLNGTSVAGLDEVHCEAREQIKVVTGKVKPEKYGISEWYEIVEGPAQHMTAPQNTARKMAM